MSDEWVQFLYDRLNEDESAASGGTLRAALPPDFNGLTREGVAHLPEPVKARVLADVKAKQRMLSTYEAAERNAKLPHPEHVDGIYPPAVFVSGFASALEHSLRLLATAYADHPDYRAEWRP